MSSLIALAAGFSKFLAPTVGTSVFGLTASVGYLLTGSSDQPLLVPGTDDLADGGATKWPGTASDRREMYRRYGTPLRVVVADDRLDEIATGWVVDRSSGGLGLELDIPVQTGSVLNLRPTQVPGMKLWVPGVVRNCRDQFDYWKVGCQFVETPPWDVLRLFG